MTLYTVTSPCVDVINSMKVEFMKSCAPEQLESRINIHIFEIEYRVSKEEKVGRSELFKLIYE